MKGLWRVSPEVPLSIGVSEVGLGVSLLAVNKVGKLNGILDEENGGVVSNHIIVAFFSVELDGKSTRISGSVS